MTAQTSDLRVLVVDDRPLMRAGLAAVLTGDGAVSDVAQAESIESAYALLDGARFDVVVVSAAQPDAVETNRRLCVLASRAGGAQVVCLGRTGQSTPPSCGRFATLPESTRPSRFLEVVGQPQDADRSACSLADCDCRHTHLAALPELTGQEARVLAALADGLSNREIAERLHVAEKTVKNHVTRIFTKLGVTSRTEAMVALRNEVSGLPH